MRKPRVPPFEAGLEHHRAGRLSEADAIYRALIAADPDHIDALHFSGVIAYQRGQHAQAAALIEAALERNPANAPAQNNLGNAFAAQGLTERAIGCYREAVRIAPGYVDAHVNLGAKLKTQGMLEEAAAAYRRALALAPGHATALSNLGAILNEQAKPLEALALCEQAVAAKPDLAEAHNNLGNALQSLGRHEEAERSFRRALQLNPDMASASLNYGFSRLLHGDYASGLALFEKRFAAAMSMPVHSGLRDLMAGFDAARRWSGQPAGGTLLVWSDQGLGDSLMTMRYLPLLKLRGFARVVVYGEPALLRLFRALPGVDHVISKQEPVPAGEFDWHCPNMSLPLAFGTRVDSIPKNIAFQIPEALERQWSEKLATVAPRRIGLAWAGSRMNPKNAVRSIRLEQFAPLFKIERINFISLQKGDGSEELAGAPGRILDRMSECGDLLDSAALVNQLDLVITVDTAVAHLAGALGRPVWMLNSYDSDWRWMLEREDSPWYPTLRLFRQDKPGDWDAPIARIGAALTASRS